MSLVRNVKIFRHVLKIVLLTPPALAAMGFVSLESWEFVSKTAATPIYQ
jgi:hypothetical protein